MITLTTNELFEIGEELSKRLIKNNVEKDATLSIKVDAESFKKIDEDVFYTLKKNGMIGEDSTFEPSEEKINLSFHNINILILNNS